MDINMKVDDKSGKITQLTFSGDGVDFNAVQKALSVLSKNFPGGEAPKEPRVAGDIPARVEDKPTLKERLRLFLKFNFQGQWFTSLQVKEKYERLYSEEIKISTVSTYLTRLYGEGVLERRGNRVEREYHVINDNVEEKVVERAVPRPGPMVEPYLK